MADEFVIRIVNDAVNQALAQMKQVDSKGKETTDAWKKELKQKEAAEAEYYKRLNSQYKQHVSSLSKDDKNYFREKQNLQLQQLSLSRNLSDGQKSILANQIRDQIAMEKAKHAESISLAYKLQSTLESVFQRAVFYTAIYKGISKITGAIDSWISSNIELDYALGKVNTISDVTVGQMAKILDISELTGRSAIDLTNALYEINSANIKGADAMRVMEVSTRAAVGGFTSAEDAADTLTDVLNAYKLSTSQTEEVSDKLLKAVEIGKLKWEEYHGVLGRILPSAYNLGVSLDDLLGSLSTLTLSGLKFNEATVGMRNIFMKMLKPTKDMDIALANLNQNLGTSYTSIKDVLKVKGVIGTLQLLGEAMKGTDVESSDLFNTVRGLTAQLSLMSDAGAEAIEITGQISNSTGQTNKVMGVMAETIVETKNRMIAAWQALGVESFGFGSIIKKVYEILADLARLLKSISPLIVGLTASISTMAIAVGILGVKFLATTYVLPILKLGLLGLSLLFGQSARNSVLASAGAELYGGAVQATGLKAIAAAAGVSTFTVALAAATMGLSLIIGGIAAYVAWSNKSDVSSQKVAESTQAMKKAFDDARNSMNLLNQVRPFAGWDINDLTKQVDENNKVLAKREELLASIADLETRIAQTKTFNTYGDELERQRKELTTIEGKNKENLKIIEAQNREFAYQTKGLSDVQVVIAEINGGFISTDKAIKDFDLNKINAIIDGLTKVSNVKPNTSFAKGLLSGLETKQFSTEADYRGKELKTTEDYLNAFIKLRKEKELEGQRVIDEEKAKELKKQTDFWQKYYEAYMNATHEGRLALIEEQRKAALAEAKLNNESNERILWLNKYYNNLITEENKKHNDELSKKSKELYDIEKKWIDATEKLKLDRDKEESDRIKKNEQEAESLRDKYSRSEIDKIQAKYDMELILAQEYIKSKDEYDKIAKEIEIQRERDLFAERVKLYEEAQAKQLNTLMYYLTVQGEQISIFADAMKATLSAAGDFLALQLQALVNQADVTAKKLKDIWKSLTNSLIAMLSQLMVKMLVVLGLKLLIGGATFDTGWFKFLMGSLNAVEGKGVSDAIIQDGTITPFRKDDVVAIGTNMYGTRSGYGTSGIEAKLDKVITAINAGTLVMAKKNMVVNVDPITPEKVNDLNRQGEKKNRMIGYATT
jgi:TP901 family phage tail tape measure protein